MCVRIIHRCQISTKIAVVESRTSKILPVVFIFQNSKNTVANCVSMHYLASLLSTFSQHFQLPKHQCKLRQNAPFIVLGFIETSSFILEYISFKKCQKAAFGVFAFKKIQEYELQKHRFQLRPNEQLSVIV